MRICEIHKKPAQKLLADPEGLELKGVRKGHIDLLSVYTKKRTKQSTADVCVPR